MVGCRGRDLCRRDSWKRLSISSSSLHPLSFKWFHYPFNGASKKAEQGAAGNSRRAGQLTGLWNPNIIVAD